MLLCRGRPAGVRCMALESERDKEGVRMEEQCVYIEDTLCVPELFYFRKGRRNNSNEGLVN